MNCTFCNGTLTDFQPTTQSQISLFNAGFKHICTDCKELQYQHLTVDTD